MSNLGEMLVEAGLSRERLEECRRIAGSTGESLDRVILQKDYMGENTMLETYAQHLGKTPSSITRWQEIPAVPTRAFKLTRHPLTCGDDLSTTFLTSGTTTETRGAHHFPDTDLYEHAITAGWPLPQLPTFFLAPSSKEAPQSSLSHMFTHLNDGLPSRFLLQDSKFHLAPLFGRAHQATTQ